MTRDYMLNLNSLSHTGIFRKNSPAIFFIFGWMILAVTIWRVATSANAELKGFYLDPSIGTLIIFLAILPAIITIIYSPNFVFWFLGASVACGALPDITHLPFIKETTHVFMFIAAIMAVRELKVRSRQFLTLLPVTLLLAYIGISVLSIAYSQCCGNAGIWELKVGVSNIIGNLCLLLLIGYLAMPDSQSNLIPRVSLLLEGFITAAFVQIIFSIIAIGLSFSDQVLPSNRSLWGLGYWYRIESLFAGPDQASLFFVASIPMIIWWNSYNHDKWYIRLSKIYLFLVPWFLASSGSRAARVSCVLILIGLLLSPVYRKQVMRILPIFLISFVITFFYQSFPDAVHDAWQLLTYAWNYSWNYLTNLFGGTASGQEHISIHLSGNMLLGRFFEDHGRSALVQSSREFFLNSDLIRKLIGYGPGTIGFAASKYPSVHNELATLLETGLLGFAIKSAFVLHVIYGLWRTRQHPLVYALLISLLAVVISSATYPVQMWGTTLVIMVLSIALPKLYTETQNQRSYSSNS